MPNSRRRTNPNKRGKKPSKRYNLEIIKGVCHLKRHVIETVRNEDDFAALNRVGRLHNALALMVDWIHSSEQIDHEKPLTLRSFHRMVFNTAGYVYEGYKVVESLSYEYIDEPFFEGFARILNDPEKSKKKKLMRLMRDAVAFHLDADNQYTKKALTNLRLSRVPFISGDNDNRMGSMYFHLPDILDVNYVIDQLKRPDDSDEIEANIYKDMQMTAVELAGAFLEGGDQFSIGISYKLGIFKY